MPADYSFRSLHVFSPWAQWAYRRHHPRHNWKGKRVFHPEQFAFLLCVSIPIKPSAPMFSGTIQPIPFDLRGSFQFSPLSPKIRYNSLVNNSREIRLPLSPPSTAFKCSPVVGPQSFTQTIGKSWRPETWNAIGVRYENHIQSLPIVTLALLPVFPIFNPIIPLPPFPQFASPYGRA